jgi:starch synthase
MKILLAASEVVGFAKTGGLADVVGSLPRALARRGHECAVILPLYRSSRRAKAPPQSTAHSFTVQIGHRAVPGRVWLSRLPDSDISVYLIEQADFFDRDDSTQGRGLYQWTTTAGEKRDYADNCERFTFFCRAILESLPLLGCWPDVLHANDWQTGLIPVYLKEIYGPASRDSFALPAKRRSVGFDRIRTLFTIHNIAYQGTFWHLDMPLTGLDWKLFNDRQLEFYGHLSFLKGGIVFADLLNTVSPSYAHEIQTPYYGCGLQGVLSERREDLFGIVNGVDYDEWNPATDKHIAAHYDVETVCVGKPLCKQALQERCHLPAEPRSPLLAVVARLAEQKGVELILGAAGTLLNQGCQLAVLGEGDPKYHRQLTELRGRYPERMSLTLGFDEPFAHQIEAGADIFLMPSIYEPSGLNQLYSMKYGTVPVVRATGGLADTVVDCTPEALSAGRATGFGFLARTADALRESVLRALALYRDEPAQWLRLVQSGMKQDWSWDRSAAEYERLYERMMAREQSPER